VLLRRDRSCLLVVDVQERLAPAMSDPVPVLRNAGILLQAARRLDVPVVVSEQYPKGLGATLPELKALAPADSILGKVSFSCAGDAGLRRRFEELARPQIVVCGMEAHVCVLQSAFGLKESGFAPFVVADAVASRVEASRDAALARMRTAGIDVVTTEMVVFEWLGCAATDEFREVSRLIR
jgi:nicotinamidase-related amidase